MRIQPIILFGLVALVCAVIQSAQRTKLARCPHLKGWQKLFGVVAFILVVVVLINPEFLAVGLVGDTAFFDVFVLLLSFLLQMIAVRAWHFVCAAFLSIMRAMLMRPALSSLMFLLIFASLTDVLSAIQKAAHRFSS